jgi:hypothetical protein
MKMNFLSAISVFLLISSLPLAFCISRSAHANDEFFSKQWSLNARGQQFLREFDDITSETVLTSSGADIGWSLIADKLPTLMKRDAVVAVLDSGLDLEHPDIASHIYKNSKECTDTGLINPQAKVDADGNGFIGDCMGWNFAAGGTGNARPYDLSGHGTHVAGIIAAVANNGIGIAGVSSRIKILPVRIIDNSEKSESPPRTDVFARGIRYAAEMKVDVINMSMGWPLSMQTPELKAAIDYALSKNIAIVAAAGNNGHGQPTFPCAIRGVICVGAMAPEGTLAEFSNFGGAVDLIAPGEFIYSLFPKTLRPVVSGVQGYEVKNGTSQAAPYVSAAAAILRTVFPGISNAEIYARLAASSKWPKPPKATTPTLNGSLDLAGALALAPRPVVQPVFKDLSQVKFSMLNRRFQILLPVKNYWAAASGVQLNVRTAETGIELDQKTYSVGEMSSYSESSVRISGRVLDPQSHCEVQLVVDVTVAGRSVGSFQTTLFFEREIEGDQNLQSFSLPVIQGFPLTDSSGSSLMRTVSDKFNLSGSPEYFVTSGGENDGRLKFALIRKGTGQSYEAARRYEIPKAQRILNFVSLDANRDGKPDYFVQSVVSSSTGLGMRFDWLDADLRPLYGSHSVWIVTVEGAALSANFGFLPWKDPDLGEVSLPVFSAIGRLPKADQVSDPFDVQSQPGELRHLYFINPVLKDGIVHAQTRILDTNAVRLKIREELGGTNDLAVDTAGLIPQSAEDFSSRRVHALFLVGRAGARVPYLVTFAGYEKFTMARIEVSGESIGENVILPLRRLTGAVADFSAGASFVNLFDPHRARTLNLYPQSTLVGLVRPSTSAELDYRKGRRDLILNGLGGFEDGRGAYIFYLSKRRFLMQYVSSGQIRAEYEAPIYRYSFLPGAVFNQMYFPVSYGNRHGRYAAFYLDNSAINRHSVQLLIATNQGLSRPMNMSIALSPRCQSLNPVRLGDEREFSFAFQCGNELKFLPMKL